MPEQKKTQGELPPARWQITATTIPCDLVDESVTLMVKKDWSAGCVWYKRFKQKFVEEKQKFDKKTMFKIGKCEGPDCFYVTGYREKLIKQEFGE